MGTQLRPDVAAPRSPTCLRSAHNQHHRPNATRGGEDRCSGRFARLPAGGDTDPEGDCQGLRPANLVPSQLTSSSSKTGPRGTRTPLGTAMNQLAVRRNGQPLVLANVEWKPRCALR